MLSSLTNYDLLWSPNLERTISLVLGVSFLVEQLDHNTYNGQAEQTKDLTQGFVPRSYYWRLSGLYITILTS